MTGQNGQAGRRPGTWLTFSVLVLSLAGTLIAWRVVIAYERLHIQKTARLATAAVRGDLVENVGGRISGQVRLANLWEVGNGPTYPEWKASAELFIQHHPGCLAIEWFQPTYQERWVIRPQGTGAGSLVLPSDKVQSGFLDSAMKSRGPTLSPAMLMGNGVRERVFSVPIYRGEKFGGLVLAFYAIQQTLDEEFADVAELGYSIAISEGSQEIYRLPGASNQYNSEWGQTTEVSLPGVTWKIRVWPKPDTLKDMKSRFPQVMLLLGAALSLFLTLTAHFAQTVMVKSFKLRLAIQHLTGEIAERHRTEDELRTSQARFAGMLESSADAVVSVDEDHRINLFNQAAERIFGRKAEEVIGEKLDILLPEGLRGAHHQHIAHFAESAQQTMLMSERRRIAGLRSDGSEFPVEASVSKLEIGGKKTFTAILRDVTERVRAEEELRRARDELELRVQERTADLQMEIAERKRATESLRELSGRLLQLQDEERRRLARELHDSTVQNLVALAMNLKMIREIVPPDAQTAKAVEDCVWLIEQCTTEIRSMSYLLHPPLLDELGLPSALRSYVEGFSARSGIHVNLEVSPELSELPRDVELTVFRIAQEGLGNVRRHSRSRTAQVVLLRNAGALSLEISDQGQGIPPKALEGMNGKGLARVGVGIAGMRERVRLLGGQFEINTGSQGTTIRVLLPLPESQLLSASPSKIA